MAKKSVEDKKEVIKVNGFEGELETVPAVSEKKDVVLSDKQKADLTVINQKVVDVKCRIADLTEQLIVAKRQVEQGEQQRHSLFDELYAAQNEYRTQLSNIARLNGIDPDAKPEETGVSYQFDGEKFIFVPFNNNNK